jgi:hypothetical protein
MKQLTLLASAALSWSLAVRAQSTFTSADVPSQIGAQYRAYVTTAETDMSARFGVKGGPQRWDFSQPKGTDDDIYRVEVVSPADGGKGASFPVAAYAERTTRESSGEQSWSYYRIVPAQGRAYYGFYDPVANPAKPETVFSALTVDLPDNLQFGKTWNRSVDFKDVVDLGFSQSDLAVHFTSEAEVDAYGTIVLPGVGEAPALRVNEVNTYEIRELTLGLPLPAQHFRNYYWLVKGVGKAVHIVSKGDTAIPPENFKAASTVLRTFEAPGLKPALSLLGVTNLDVSLRGKDVFLNWQREPTATIYRIETSVDLKASAWELLAETKDNFWFDPIVRDRRFYRAGFKQ